MCGARSYPALATLENLAERYPELAPHLGPRGVQRRDRASRSCRAFIQPLAMIGADAQDVAPAKLSGKGPFSDDLLLRWNIPTSAPLLPKTDWRLSARRGHGSTAPIEAVPTGCASSRKRTLQDPPLRSHSRARSGIGGYRLGWVPLLQSAQVSVGLLTRRRSRWPAQSWMSPLRRATAIRSGKARACRRRRARRATAKYCAATIVVSRACRRR